MFAIPLAIFILPAVLKKTRYCLDPIEVVDGSNSQPVNHKGIESKTTCSTSDEDSSHPPSRSPSPCEPEVLQRVDTPMEEVHDVDMVDGRVFSGSCKSEDLDVKEKETATIGSPETRETPPKSEFPRTASPAHKPGLCSKPAKDIENDSATSPPNMRPSESPTPPNALARRASSRVATLRAAFEQVDRADEDPKRRHVSNESINGRNLDARKEWEAENSRLRTEVERERDLRLAYEERVTSLEDELEELNLQMAEQNEAWDEECRRRCAEAAAQVEERLNRQISELKRDVSIATRASVEVSDAYFQEQFGLLYHEIQNWVVNSFRRVKVEATPLELCSRIQGVADPYQSERLQRLYQEFDLTVRLPTYHSTVMNVLVEIFDFPYTFGPELQESWFYHTCQAANTLPEVLAASVYNRWRALTFNAIRQTEVAKNFAETSVHSISQKIVSILGAITESDLEDTKLASLRNIIKRVIELSDLMRVQQASYVFAIPSPGDLFDLETMEDITIEPSTGRGNAESGRTVKFATSPSIIKISDEHGESLDLRKVIVKANVLCKLDP